MQVDEATISADLDSAWEVLAEPIQTVMLVLDLYRPQAAFLSYRIPSDCGGAGGVLQVMRRYGIEKPYEKLKDFSRGQAVSRESIKQFVDTLDLPAEAKHVLQSLTPSNYIGVAAFLAKEV